MFGLKRKRATVTEVPAVIEEPVVPEVTPFPDKPVRVSLAPDLSEEGYAEYSKLAQEVGLDLPELLIERFKHFLVKNDFPVYDLKTVIGYMDAVAKRDNPTGYGWTWRPLRYTDTEKFLMFGRAAARYSGRIEGHSKDESSPEGAPASDFFSSQWYWDGGMAPATPYDKVVPLHALKRVAAIDEEFGQGTILFAVSDYQTHPHVRPDPFLMAMILNPEIESGVGRFVIDVWDEPGFGLDLMLR